MAEKIFFADSEEILPNEIILERVREARQQSAETFIVVKCRQSAKFRLQAFAAGANMLANEGDENIEEVFEYIRSKQQSKEGKYACHICGMSGLTENGLHRHLPLYHQSEPNTYLGSCPICKQKDFPYESFEVHLHNFHGPVEEREVMDVPSLAAFAWVVVRHPKTGRFLISNEPAAISGGIPGYWLPAGRVDHGETFVQAGIRETLEEAGVSVRITGVIKFMLEERVVPRIILMGEPIDENNCVPKSIVDYESCGSFWITVDDVKSLHPRSDFRGSDPLRLFPAIHSGTMDVYDIDNEAFQGLERMVSALTTQRKDERAFIPTIAKVWKDLERQYPAEAFKY